MTHKSIVGLPETLECLNMHLCKDLKVFTTKMLYLLKNASREAAQLRIYRDIFRTLPPTVEEIVMETAVLYSQQFQADFGEVDAGLASRKSLRMVTMEVPYSFESVLPHLESSFPLLRASGRLRVRKL